MSRTPSWASRGQYGGAPGPRQGVDRPRRSNQARGPRGSVAAGQTVAEGGAEPKALDGQQARLNGARPAGDRRAPSARPRSPGSASEAYRWATASRDRLGNVTRGLTSQRRSGTTVTRSTGERAFASARRTVSRPGGTDPSECTLESLLPVRHGFPAGAEYIRPLMDSGGQGASGLGVYSTGQVEYDGAAVSRRPGRIVIPARLGRPYGWRSDGHIACTASRTAAQNDSISSADRG